jgi:hypothetical protein
MSISNRVDNICASHNNCQDYFALQHKKAMGELGGDRLRSGKHGAATLNTRLRGKQDNADIENRLVELSNCIPAGYSKMSLECFLPI